MMFSCSVTLILTVSAHPPPALRTHSKYGKLLFESVHLQFAQTFSAGKKFGLVKMEEF